MVLSESRVGRRLVGRLDRGVNLHDAVLAICRERSVRSGELRAVGALESVEVAEYDQAAQSWKPSRTFTGGLEVLSLLGHISEQAGKLVVTLRGTFMRDRDSGIEIVGGTILRARVFALELVLDSFDDLLLRRAQDPATGLPLWSEAVTPAATWSDVAKASAAKPVSPPVPLPPPVNVPVPLPVAADSESVSDSDETDDSLEPGDILHHPTFGRCEVQRIEGNYEFAQVRLRNGRLVRLSLDVLRVARAGTEGGHRVFKADLDD